MGVDNVDLRQGDARCLPFADQEFDVVYNTYMMDLLPLRDLSVAVEEFRRVLKPGGRLGLVNFSKKPGAPLTLWERVYGWMPECCVPYVMGGCRPVLLEDSVRQTGLTHVERELVRGLFPSEIITARKPL